MARKAALAKRTYKLSEETVQRFERAVPAGQRSQTLDRLMRESVEEIERERLRREIAEGLEDMAEVYEETMREWASTDRDGWPES